MLLVSPFGAYFMGRVDFPQREAIDLGEYVKHTENTRVRLSGVILGRKLYVQALKSVGWIEETIIGFC